MTIIRPVTIRQATAFVALYHRHSGPPRGARFAIALLDDTGLLGVAIFGRPVARGLDDGLTAEATRVCVRDMAPKGSCSRLLRAGWRAWAAMGGERMVTYTLASETGASLRGAGFLLVGTVPGRKWDTPTRQRKARAIEAQDKLRWEMRA